jgi:hypothetical protein
MLFSRPGQEAKVLGPIVILRSCVPVVSPKKVTEDVASVSTAQKRDVTEIWQRQNAIPMACGKEQAGSEE